MKYSDYNDNEIVYLIQSGSEEAYIFLVSKYKKMIYSRIYKYKLKDIDDAYQEGIIALYNAALSFNKEINKTFNKYFEVVLTHRFFDIKRKMKLDYEYFLSENIIKNTCCINESIETLSKKNRVDEIIGVLDVLNTREKNVFYEYYILNMQIDEIAMKENIDRQYIYYLIHEIKDKIKKYMIK